MENGLFLGVNANLAVPDLTKASIQAAGEQCATRILDEGQVTALEALIKLRALQEAIGVAVENLKPEAMKVAEDFTPDDRKLFGVEFAVRNGTTKFDFSNDTKWSELDEAVKKATAERKKRQDMLKNLTDRVVDPVTGEYVYPPDLTVGSRVLAISFPEE